MAELPSGWNLTHVKEVAGERGLVGGPFGSSLGTKDYVADGVPVIRGGNLASDGYFDSSDFVFVSDEKADSLARNIALPGDLVLTQRGTLGQVGLVPEGIADRFVISQSQMRLRCDRSRADEKFLYYVFCSPKMLATIGSQAIVTGVPHINLGMLGDFEVLLPPLAEQRAIAEVLGALDDKIELNRRVVEKLDAIAQLTYLVSESDSWVELMLRDCVELLPGKYLSKDEYGALGAYPVFGSNSRMGRGPRFLYEGPVIAMARIGSNFGAVMWSTESAWINNNASGVRALPGFDLKHIFYWLRAFDFESIRRGSGQPFVAHEDLYAQVIRLPQEEERQRISESVSAMFDIIDQCERENLLLESARDTLLPALLSGRIRVPVAVELVEAS